MPAPMPDVQGVTHRHVELPRARVRIHLAEAGPSDATPVLLLHGWPQHWYMWRHVLGALGDRHRLLAPDLRGFGWSDTPGSGYDPVTFAADQLELLDVLGLDRVRVAGHDWGGFTTFLLALRDPDRVERALVFNAPHPWPRRSPRLLTETWRWWYVAVTATPFLGRITANHGLTRLMLTRLNGALPFEDEDEVRVYTDQFRDPARRKASEKLYQSYLGSLASALAGGRLDAGSRLQVPTRLVFGMRDAFVSPLLLPGWETHADDMSVEEVSDCGHFIVNERPALAVERVDEMARA